MKTVVFRVLGGQGIGYGHYFRCLSLAKAFSIKNKNVSIIFIVNEGLKYNISYSGFKFIINDDLNCDNYILQDIRPNLVIFDSYLGNDSYLTALKMVSKLMIIDDNNDIYDSAIPDILVNGNIHAGNLGYLKNKGAVCLLGPEYLIMREEYWNEDDYKSGPKEGMLITTGGTDPYHISYEILKEVIEIPGKKKIVIGPGYEKKIIKNIKELNKGSYNVEVIYKPDSLKKYIAESQVAITAGGSTVYEILSQKTIPILFSMADNQDLICKELVKHGIDYINKYPEINYDKLKSVIKKNVNKEYCESLNLFNLFDGKGALRVAQALEDKLL